MGRRRTFAALLLLLLLGACSTAPVERPADDDSQLVQLQRQDYPGAAAILSGIAPDDDDVRLRIGDAALFALDLRRGDTITRELLLLEVVGLGMVDDGRRRVRTATITWTPAGGSPETQEIVLREVDLALRRFDAAGRPIADSKVVLFEEALRTGWWPDTESDASRREQNLAFAMTMSLQNLIDSDPTLQDLLFVVADKPSLFSIAAHLGVRVNVQTTVDHGRRRELPPFDDLPPATTVRVTNQDLTINGSRALWVDLFVTRPTGALGACAGLVGAVARNADDPERRAAVRLLATRRGS